MITSAVDRLKILLANMEATGNPMAYKTKIIIGKCEKLAEKYKQLDTMSEGPGKAKLRFEIAMDMTELENEGNEFAAEAFGIMGVIFFQGAISANSQAVDG